jgi:NitT/TauT family transport system permease protein
VRRTLTVCLFFVVLLGTWEFLVRAGTWSRALVPTPLDVGRYLGTHLADGSLVSACLVTLRRLAVGYLIGAAVGLPIGFLTARFRMLADTVGVVALGLQGLPSVCWVPLALLWFGMTEKAMIFVVVMGTAWSISIATESGIRHVPPLYVRAARTMGSRGLHTITHVVLPASLPFVLSGMKQGWAFAWRSLMAAEIYVTLTGAFGLGLHLHHGRELHRMDQVVGVMLVIVAVGLAADKVLFAPAERFLRRRWGTETP